jgi:hypothetical protein
LPAKAREGAGGPDVRPQLRLSGQPRINGSGEANYSSVSKDRRLRSLT